MFHNSPPVRCQSCPWYLALTRHHEIVSSIDLGFGPMMLVRDTGQLFGTAAKPSATPDSNIYRPVPFLNHQSTLVGLIVTFLVTFPSLLWHT